jgi:RNA polymerase sigma-70 factor, ECF subfamily
MDLDAVYRRDSRKVLATLIRLLGDFDLAEDALQDAFVEAAARWPETGMPDNPSAWLISTGRFKAIDRIRRQSRFSPASAELLDTVSTEATPIEHDHAEIEDDRLRLIFTCCHPSIGEDVQVALTLREVCGLTTEEIAAAFLTTPPTLAQRIVRAKRKIRDAAIPYEVPGRKELPERLDSVLKVVYLVFNEGYAASSGNDLTRPDLSSEAIYLGRLLADMMPEPEVLGLVGLMLLNESRRDARADDKGDIVLLPDQDRSKWDQAMIEEGRAYVKRAIEAGPVGLYTLQAAISAIHSSAVHSDDTDWREIVSLYDLMLRIQPSPVIALNRAVAISMLEGPEPALSLVDELIADGSLQSYHLLHATRADLLRRLGRRGDALEAYRTARSLASSLADIRFLERRINALR